MPLKTFTYVKTASLRWTRKTNKGRELLSVNMISLPLGDFKHLSHIGLDAKGHHSFGDLSAFQNHQDLLQSAPAKPPRLLPATEEVQRRALPPGHRKSHSLPLLDDLELMDVGEKTLPPPPPPPPPPPGRGDGRSQEEEGEEEGGLRMTHNASHQDEELSFDLGPSILDDVLQVMDRHQ